MSTSFQIQIVLDARDALIELMKVMARYGRPARYPDDLRAAWDECERVLGAEVAVEIGRVTSICMQAPPKPKSRRRAATVTGRNNE